MRRFISSCSGRPFLTQEVILYGRIGNSKHYCLPWDIYYQKNNSHNSLYTETPSNFLVPKRPYHRALADRHTWKYTLILEKSNRNPQFLPFSNLPHPTKIHLLPIGLLLILDLLLPLLLLRASRCPTSRPTNKIVARVAIRLGFFVLGSACGCI